ncbi:Crp/Fnr family transcriptional regulator [Hymenobacter aerilatus]|uniref:Crp/Fnr family transcriptional regulator n=1 Tax=Hymenobacter aerilatus TaxID=2932251 RepID=A0A8T9T1C3_9BACT|nr:Crp/Fnr family transcriptional regulator [Hymenobacter aerilatus]UOR06964.1 Crp/Fnr family transcriptional regulator [Hymenobacter aerilatus]
MYESLLAYVRSLSSTPLTEQETQLIKEVFTPRKLRKRQYFLQPGEVCQYMGFVVSGAMRQYTVDGKGAEHVFQLSIENWWAGDRESFTMLTPSRYYIDAWEDTTLLTIPKTNHYLLDTLPAFGEMITQINQRHSFALQHRVNAALSLSAEQRYAELVHTYPEFLQRFPQHVIASYLGITKETLSRVRSLPTKK